MLHKTVKRGTYDPKRPENVRSESPMANFHAVMEAAQASKRNVTKVPPSQWRVEDDTVTYAQMGERLGCTQAKASLAHKKALKMDGPVTWDRLAKCVAPDRKRRSYEVSI